MEAIDEQILRNLAWVFTVLSGAVSIALSIHKFGLSPGKRIAAIIGVLLVGVTIAILFISDLSPFKQLRFLTSDQAEKIQTAHEKDGNRASGYEVTDDGITENSAGGVVNRITDYIYGVKHPNGDITAVYNGGFFDAEIGGRTVNCELIKIDSDRVLIIIGNDLETVSVSSDQTENTFKVQKIPVAKPR